MNRLSSPTRWQSTRRHWLALVALCVSVALVPAKAFAGVTLKLGDILLMETGRATLTVVDATTGVKTTITSGGLLLPVHKSIGVALAADGDIIVVHRLVGVIKINPITGVQTLLSSGGLFKDPWSVTVNKTTGDIFVADSGYDQERPEINLPGRIIKVDPVTGAQTTVASGTACTSFPAGAACQNTTSAGSYLSHPYGIAMDYTTSPATLVVADMSSFNGKGAIIRIAPSTGTQTLLWGPSTAVPAPVVAQTVPFGCPMGVAVEPNGNIVTTSFTFPNPATPTYPPPAGTYYGCAPPGTYRIDLANHAQTVVNANAPPRVASTSYAVGSMIRDNVGGAGHVHKVITAGVSSSGTPNWNNTIGGTTSDGSVVWQNVGNGANWIIPFGLDSEPTPTQADPLKHNIIVADEYYSTLYRMDSNGVLSATPAATDTTYAPALSVISFTPQGGFKTDADTTPPQRTNGQPSGILAFGTTQATLSLNTDENATCRYSQSAGVSYASMTGTFTTTGGTSHSRTITGLTNGTGYAFYVRCSDTLGNANTNDYAISFSIASTSSPSSSFTGSEGVLSEGGMWDSPGSWSDLQKNNGAFTPTLNAAGRLTNPLLGPDQYSEITYDVDPGTLSWVGVMTRIQSSSNGGGYLVIAYAGEVRLYRADDAGGLSFTQLAGATVNISTAPRRLRLESVGNNHKVFFNGVQVINYNASAPVYTAGQPGIAASTFGGPQVRIQTFQGGDLSGAPPPDTTPPFRTNGQPSGVLTFGTTQATLSLTTNENATCRYSQTAGVAYASMTGTFTTTGATSHSRTVTGLTNGGTYNYYVRCIDAASNANPDDFAISFSVAATSGPSSSFSGTETILSEGGIWDSPGSWTDLAKNSGAFANTVNAAARLATPILSANHYSEITYQSDPGSLSWVGVMTRIQGANNGSGYLAIVYAGEVRLYRSDDSGGLSFTQLAGVAASVGTAPRRLRLESSGNTHKVYLNGVLLITYNASGTSYLTGQPGIAASVFGGPQVKILSFEGGSLN
jgi:hypothetical protein